MPDNANAALEEFWNDVGAGFDEILQKLTRANNTTTSLI
jgi:hypothetical protein